MNIKLEGRVINTDHIRDFEAYVRQLEDYTDSGSVRYINYFYPELDVYVVWSNGTEEVFRDDDALSLMEALRAKNSAETDALAVYFADVNRRYKEWQSKCETDNKELEREREERRQEDLNQQYENLGEVLKDYYETS